MKTTETPSDLIALSGCVSATYGVSDLLEAFKLLGGDPRDLSKPVAAVLSLPNHLLLRDAVFLFQGLRLRCKRVGPLRYRFWTKRATGQG